MPSTILVKDAHLKYLSDGENLKPVSVEVLNMCQVLAYEVIKAHRATYSPMTVNEKIALFQLIGAIDYDLMEDKT